MLSGWLAGFSKRVTLIIVDQPLLGRWIERKLRPSSHLLSLAAAASASALENASICFIPKHQVLKMILENPSFNFKMLI